MAAKSYTANYMYKLKVIDWYHTNVENEQATARHFQVDRKRIHNWVEKEDHLQQLLESG